MFDQQSDNQLSIILILSVIIVMAEELTRILPANSPDLLLLQELDAEYILPAETDSEDEIIRPQTESILDTSSSDHDEDLLSAIINNEADVALQGLKQNDDTVLAGDADIV